MGRFLQGAGWACVLALMLTLAVLIVALLSSAAGGGLQTWATTLVLGGFVPFVSALLFAALAQDRLQKEAERRTGRRQWLPVAGLSWSGLASRAPRPVQWLGLAGVVAGFGISLWTGGVAVQAGEAMDLREIRGTLAWALIMYSVAAPLLMSKGAAIRHPLQPLMPGDSTVHEDAF